jgi:hypothetical protein
MRLISPTLRCRSSIVFAVLTVSSCVALMPATVRCTVAAAARVLAHLLREVRGRLRAGEELGDRESISATNDSTSSPIVARTSVRFDVSVIVAFISVADDDVFSTD